MLPEKLGRRLRARSDVEFFVDMAEVRSDRAKTYSEALADFLIEIALGKKGQNLLLPRGEHLHFVS